MQGGDRRPVVPVLGVVVVLDDQASVPGPCASARGGARRRAPLRSGTDARGSAGPPGRRWPGARRPAGRAGRPRPAGCPAASSAGAGGCRATGVLHRDRADSVPEQHLVPAGPAPARRRRRCTPRPDPPGSRGCGPASWPRPGAAPGVPRGSPYPKSDGESWLNTDRSARSQAARGNAARSGRPGDRSIRAGAARSESKTSAPGTGPNSASAAGGLVIRLAGPASARPPERRRRPFRRGRARQRGRLRSAAGRPR